MAVLTILYSPSEQTKRTGALAVIKEDRCRFQDGQEFQGAYNRTARFSIRFLAVTSIVWFLTWISFPFSGGVSLQFISWRRSKGTVHQVESLSWLHPRVWWSKCMMPVKQLFTCFKHSLVQALVLTPKPWFHSKKNSGSYMSYHRQPLSVT